MPYYKPPVNFEPHNFNSSTLTVISADLDGPVTIDGLDTIEVEFTNNRWGTQASASGMAIHTHNPSKEGTIKITLLEASSSSATLSQLARSDAPITVTFTDQNAPELNCSSQQARVEKHAMVKRSNEVDTPEWVFVCTYMTSESGGYRLQTVE